MRNLVLTALATVALIKDVALVWSVFSVLSSGGRIVNCLRRRGTLDSVNFAAQFNPFDRRLDKWATSDRRRAATRLFTAPVVIVACSAGPLVLPTDDLPTILGGILTAACAALLIVMAVLRRFLLGPEEWKTSDVAVPKLGSLKHWAIGKDGANRSVYFLALLFLSVLGFAALYAGIGSISPGAFHFDGSTDTGGVTWLYLSITTVATVGFGDIHPQTAWAEAAVTGQIALGPVLLTWLVSALGEHAEP